MNWLKKIFNGKAHEEEIKFQLALGKYVWRNKQEKIDKLTAENGVLNTRIEILMIQLKQERDFNAKLLSERRNKNGDNKQQVHTRSTVGRS
jgi:hypothetical protein